MGVRRSIHMSIALLAVLVLIRPLDCLAGGFTRKAAACCAKGKCLPSSNADECCKGTVPGGNDVSRPKTAGHSTILHALTATSVPIVIEATLIAVASFGEAHALTGS